MRKIKEIWDQLWSNRIKGQEVYRDLCFYHIVSSVLNETQADYRVHILFVCESSSGKTEGIELVKSVLDALAIRNHSLSDVTTATLVGQIDTVARSHNEKYGLSSENPETISKNGDKVVYRPSERYGLLKDDISIMFSEAELVLKPNKYNEDIQATLRQVMDKARRITKGVSSGLLEYTTNCSILMVTYPLPVVLKQILETGLLQRCFFLYKILSDAEHCEIFDFQRSSKFSNTSISSDQTSLIQELVTGLERMKQFYQQKRPKFTAEFYNRATDQLAILNQKILDDESSSAIVSFLKATLRRSIDKLQTISVLNSVSRFSEEITPDDFDVALSLYWTCTSSVVEMTGKFDKEFHLKAAIKTAIMESNGTKTKTQLVEQVHSILNPKNGRSKLAKSKTNGIGKNKIWDAFGAYEKARLILNEGDGLRWRDETSLD